MESKEVSRDLKKVDISSASTEEKRRREGEKSDSTYYYQVRGVDQAGNEGTWSDYKSIQVTVGGTTGDTAPPSIEDPYTTSGALCASGTGSPTKKAVFVRADDSSTGGSNIAGGTLHYKGPGGSWSQVSMSDAFGSFNLPKTKLYASVGPFSSTGTVSYYVSVTDAAGNTGYRGRGVNIIRI